MAGKGSLEKRGDNTWRLVVSCGMKGDQQVKKKKTVTVKVACKQKTCRGCTRTVRCQARREAEKLLAEFVLEIEKGMFIEPARLSFKDFVERWIRDYAEKNLAPKTLFRYKQMLNTRILPAMGHLKIEQIKPTHLLEFYANLQEDGIRTDGKPGGLSERTILHHHRLISSILQDAVEWQTIVSNPASRVKPPKVSKKQISCYDEEQVEVLLEIVENEPLKHKLLVYLAVFTGLRRGELMGLEWCDIDFDAGTLEVRQASQYIPGAGQFTKDPKNETSERLLSLPPFLIDMLKAYKKEQNKKRLKIGDLWQGSDRLFTTWDGKPGHPEWPSQWFPKFIKAYNIEEAFNAEISSISNTTTEQELSKLDEIKIRYLKHIKSNSKTPKKVLNEIERAIVEIIGEKGLERLKQRQVLPPLPFHGLRHISATMLINTGLPAKSISGRMGHSNIETTYNIYGHYLKSADKEAADRLEKLYQNMKDKGKTNLKKGQA